MFIIVSVDTQAKIDRLELENVKIREEFNVQRAKMKELFLQKEGKYSTSSFIIVNIMFTLKSACIL